MCPMSIEQCAHCSCASSNHHLWTVCHTVCGQTSLCKRTRGQPFCAGQPTEANHAMLYNAIFQSVQTNLTMLYSAIQVCANQPCKVLQVCAEQPYNALQRNIPVCASRQANCQHRDDTLANSGLLRRACFLLSK